jgi:hypothetical protein
MSAMRIETKVFVPPRDVNPVTLNTGSEQFRYSRLSCHDEPISLGMKTKQQPPIALNRSNLYELNSPSICDEIEEEGNNTGKKKCLVQRKSSQVSANIPPRAMIQTSGKHLRKLHKRNIGNKI